MNAQPSQIPNGVVVADESAVFELALGALAPEQRRASVSIAFRTGQDGEELAGVEFGRDLASVRICLGKLPRDQAGRDGRLRPTPGWKADLLQIEYGLGQHSKDTVRITAPSVNRNVLWSIVQGMPAILIGCKEFETEGITKSDQRPLATALECPDDLNEWLEAIPGQEEAEAWLGLHPRFKQLLGVHNPMPRWMAFEDGELGERGGIRTNILYVPPEFIRRVEPEVHFRTSCLDVGFIQDFYALRSDRFRSRTRMETPAQRLLGGYFVPVTQATHFRCGQTAGIAGEVLAHCFERYAGDVQWSTPE